MIPNFYLEDFKKAAFNCKFYNFKCLSFRWALNIDLKTEKQDSVSLLHQTPIKIPALWDFTKSNIKKYYNKHFRLLELNFISLLIFFSINVICLSFIYENETKLSSQFIFCMFESFNY